MYAWNNNNDGSGSQDPANPDENSVTSRYGPPLQEDSWAKTPSIGHTDTSGETSSISSSSESSKVDPLRVESDLTDTQDSHKKESEDHKPKMPRSINKRRNRK